MFYSFRMAEWVLFQFPEDVSLSALDGQQLNLADYSVQNVGDCKVLITQTSSDHVLPLREKKGKLRVAGSLSRSAQVLK